MRLCIVTCITALWDNLGGTGDQVPSQEGFAHSDLILPPPPLGVQHIVIYTPLIINILINQCMRLILQNELVNTKNRIQVDKLYTLFLVKMTFATHLLAFLCCDQLRTQQQKVQQTRGINPYLSLSTCILYLDNTHIRIFNNQQQIMIILMQADINSVKLPRIRCFLLKLTLVTEFLYSD